MKFLYDLLPLIVFFAAFKFYDIYIATAAAIVISMFQVAAFRVAHGRFEKMQVITLVLLTVLGGMTIALQNEAFIKWKPTMVCWIFAAVFLATSMFRTKTAVAHLFDKHIDLPPRTWQKFNLAWALFFLAVGCLNLYVAFYYNLAADAASRTAMWVNFKVFVMPGMLIGFMLVQLVIMGRHQYRREVEELAKHKK